MAYQARYYSISFLLLICQVINNKVKDFLLRGAYTVSPLTYGKPRRVSLGRGILIGKVQRPGTGKSTGLSIVQEETPMTYASLPS